MIGLGLRFTLRGGREAAVRLVLTTAGIAVAVTLLLMLLAGFNGLHQQDVRQGWLLTSAHNREPSVPDSSTDVLRWKLTGDLFEGRQIVRVDVAATGPDSPVLPGMNRLPRPGEYFVSPALADVMSVAPHRLLGDRFPGRRAGLLPENLLTSPTALMVLVGRSPAELTAADGAIGVHSIETAAKQHSYTTSMQVLLGLGAIGLLVPILVFVSTATRLAAARREERFAALRLVGATPRQVRIIAAVDSVVAAVIGTGIGFLLFWAFRPLIARLPFTGQPFFASDLSLSGPVLAAVVVGVPVVAVAAALRALHRVQISPLGVSRRVSRRPPRAIRLVPLAIGLLVLAVLSFERGVVGSSAAVVIIVVFAIMIVGLMIAGPWLTMRCARVLARLARRDSTLIAARRLSDDPSRAFRAISGLVVAVFVGSVFLGASSATVAQYQRMLKDAALPAGAFVVDLRNREAAPQAAVRDVTVRLRDLGGVAAVVPIHRPSQGLAPAGQAGKAWGVAAAADWNRFGALGMASSQSGAVTVPVDRLVQTDVTARSWKARAVPESELRAQPIIALLLLTDGRVASVERARTMIEVALPNVPPPMTVGEIEAVGWDFVNLLKRLVEVGIILTLVIAGCSLSVGTAGGLVERKRAFGMLRLAGMPLARLRRVVLLEAAVPLVLAAAVSAAAGLASAALIVSAGSGMGMAAPSWSYWALVVGGVVAALLVVAATLPLLGNLTEPESVRME